MFYSSKDNRDCVCWYSGRLTGNICLCLPVQVVPCFSKVSELETLDLKFSERNIYFIIFCYITVLRIEGNLGYFNILLITHRHLILWVDKDEIDADQITCYDFKSGVDLNKLQKWIWFKLLEVFKNMVYIRPII